MFGAGCSGESVASQIVCAVSTLIVLAIFIRAILSWFNMDPHSPLIVTLRQITEPFLEPIRRFMPRMGIDLSPMIAILVIQLLISPALQQFFG